MIPCLSCRTENATDSKFCQKCGKPLESDSSRPVPNAVKDQETVRWTGPAPAALRESARRPIALETLFAVKKRILIGRAPDCDVCLSHPMVSRYHAMLERTLDGLRLRD